MSIIRKIIIKEWLLFFISSALVLILILALGHLLTNLMKSNTNLAHILLTLLYELPGFLVKIFPVSCLIASLFSLNKLKNRNELTAIFAAGFSRKKFILTICMLGTLVGVVLFFINAYLVPYAKHKANLDENPNGTNTVSTNTISAGKIWFKGKNYFVSYSSFDSASNTINNLSLYYFNPDFKINELVSSQTATYQKDQSWLLKNFTHNTNLHNETFPSSHFKPLQAWNIDETLQDFKKINSDISTLSIWKLYEYVQILRSNHLNANEYYVTFLEKFASGFTCLVLSILSAVAIFNPNRRHSSFGKNVSFVLGFTFLYWFVYSYFLTLGQGSRIPAIFATFGVPFLFAFYLMFFFLYHRKLR